MRSFPRIWPFRNTSVGQFKSLLFFHYSSMIFITYTRIMLLESKIIPWIIGNLILFIQESASSVLNTSFLVSAITTTVNHAFWRPLSLRVLITYVWISLSNRKAQSHVHCKASHFINWIQLKLFVLKLFVLKLQ